MGAADGGLRQLDLVASRRHDARGEPPNLAVLRERMRRYKDHYAVLINGARQ
ncbi:hypothetical protein ACFO1B_56470 [Dactylosporangium siamense]|uniref:hypothetical protein n=1 Tax=Dactylosporangium siamense TaxID=685454 RepID=UPI0019404DA1|nr:hypothetical protein [Dactylosporangium siamense]